MATRTLKPDMLAASNLNAVVNSNASFLNNQKLGQHRELGLEILNASNTNLVYLKPVTTIDGDSAYIINIKGKVNRLFDFINDCF